MKRFLCLLLCALMILPFAACDKAEEEASSQVEVSEEISVEPPKVPVINGVNLSEFVLVFRKTTGGATYKQVAKDFAAYVKETFGFELACREESVPAKDNEIIFGLASNRDIVKEHKAEYGFGEYKLVIKGNKVLIASSYPQGCKAGMDELLNKIKQSEDGVFSDMEAKGEKKIIKVACVGDSITQGINSTDPKNMTYPAYIQEMLGYDYYVLNAGLSGYSICDIDDYAYHKSKQFTESRELRPDVVLFALGTNDANPTPNQPYKSWTDPKYDRTNVFIRSTKNLLDAYKKANPEVQIIMILPASLFKVGADGWNAIPWTENIVKYSHPLLKQIAEEYGLQTVDMFPWSQEHKEVFTDGLHPKDETYKTFAQFIYDNIKDTIKK
ncbi:MAG: hypothetical protein J6R49_03295 [Clostridia bacterium]|nr:hypothetical protein [Clostridia bacterium]